MKPRVTRVRGELRNLRRADAYTPLVLMGDLRYWLAWVLGALFAAGMLYLAWWGLFGDREKGRRRCPKCWFDLTGTPADPPLLRCNECGHAPADTRALHRTRRRWTSAILAMVALALSGAFVLQRASDNGWASLLPSRALIAFMPFSDPAGDMFTELQLRLRRGELSEGQVVALVRRCTSGDWSARPPSDAWIAKYGDLLRFWQRNLVTQDKVEEMLLALPPRIDLVVRDPWPAGTPIAAQLQARDWWPLDMDLRLRLAPAVAGAQPVTVIRRGEGWMRASHSILLPAQPPGEFEVTCEVEISRRRAGESTWSPSGRQTITIRASIESTIDGMLAPAQGPSLDLGLEQALGVGAVKWPSGESPVRFRLDLRPTAWPAFNDVAIGATIELVRGEAVARRLAVWWLAGEGLDRENRAAGWEVQHEDPALLPLVNEVDGQWRLRIRGDPVIALRAGGGTRYWAGDLTLPLRLEAEPGQAPPRQWSIELE
jgi:hypothetical protein